MIKSGITPLLSKSFSSALIKKNGYAISELGSGYEDLINKREYTNILNKLLVEQKVNMSNIIDELTDEIIYSINTNLYYCKFSAINALSAEQIIENISSLRAHNILYNLDNIFNKNNINSTIDLGNKTLLFIDEKIENDETIEISLAFAEGISFTKPSGTDRANNYYIVTIDYIHQNIVFKFKNWAGTAENEFKPDSMYYSYRSLIKSLLGVTFVESNIYNKCISKISLEIISEILRPTYSEVNGRIGEDVTIFINESWGKLFPNLNNQSTLNQEVLINHVLNGFYKTYYFEKYGVVTAGDFYEIYSIKKYLRTVHFLDDTISHGKAKSPFSSQSLFNTSVFYDLKARFEKTDLIKYITIYWLESKSKKYGTSLHGDIQNVLKIVFLPHKIEKERYKNVLSKIEEHIG